MSKVTIKCEQCGASKDKFPCQVRDTHNFCSLSCSVSYRNKNGFNPSHYRDLRGENNQMFGKGYLIAKDRNGMFGKKGDKCPNWKGGRSTRKDGYVRVNINGSRILEHRFVLLNAGADPTGCVVHHVDGNPSNNDISNLKIMTQSEHARLHHTKDAITWTSKPNSTRQNTL